MKNVLFIILAFLFLYTSSYADGKSGNYIGLGLAYEPVSDYDYPGMAAVLSAGMPMKSIGDGNLVIEGELSYSIIAPSYDWEYSGFSYDYYGTAEVFFTTVAVYGGYKYDVNEKVYLKPRVGLLYLKNDDEEVYSTTGISVGVGAGYKLSDAMDIYTNYTMLDGTYLTHFTVGVQYNY